VVPRPPSDAADGRLTPGAAMRDRPPPVIPDRAFSIGSRRSAGTGFPCRPGGSVSSPIQRGSLACAIQRGYRCPFPIQRGRHFSGHEGASPLSGSSRSRIDPSGPAPGIGSAPRINRTGRRLAPMGNRAISDDQIFPVIQAGPGRYRPSWSRFSPGGGMVGALGYRVGPVRISVAGLGGFVENK